MNQLTVGDILRFIKQMQNDGMTIKEIAALPVYLGRDDELNGIHTGWCTNLIDPDNEEDADFIELINEDRCNVELKGKALLIS
jgi:DNA-binding transcriptional MerR regulator